MINILNKEDFCGFYEDIALRTKSRLISLFVIFVGILLLFLAIYLKEAENLSTALLTIAFVVFGIGLVKLIQPSRVMIYTPTGEKVVRRFARYEQDKRSDVEKAIAGGDYQRLLSLESKESNAPVVAIIYSTTSGSVLIGQLLHYVPYEYEPLVEPIVYKPTK